MKHQLVIGILRKSLAKQATYPDASDRVPAFEAAINALEQDENKDNQITDARDAFQQILDLRPRFANPVREPDNDDAYVMWDDVRPHAENGLDALGGEA